MDRGLEVDGMSVNQRQFVVGVVRLTPIDLLEGDLSLLRPSGEAPFTCQLRHHRDHPFRNDAIAEGSQLDPDLCRVVDRRVRQRHRQRQRTRLVPGGAGFDEEVRDLDEVWHGTSVSAAVRNRLLERRFRGCRAGLVKFGPGGMHAGEDRRQHRLQLLEIRLDLVLGLEP